MACHGLRGADKEAVFGMVAEDGFERLRFANVSDGSRSAVGVDIINVFRLHSGVFESHLHAACGTFAFGQGGCQVVGIGTDAVADELSIDMSSAFCSVFQRFENHDTGAFAHDEAVAVYVERTGGGSRIVIARAESLHVGESGEAGGKNGSFRTAGNHDVGIPELHDAPCFSNIVVRGSTSRYDAHVGAGKAVFHSNNAGRNVADHVGDHERGNAIRATFEKSLVLGFQRAEAADAAADHDADTGLVFVFHIKTGVFNGHFSCGDGKVCETVNAA